MKKALLLGVGAVMFLSSCYCDKIAVGTIQPDEELVHVASERNVHFLDGLVVSKEKAKSNVPNVENYVVETKQTFWDGVAKYLTCYIYTPTTTKYYVPKSNPKVVTKKKKFWSKAYKGYLKE